MFAITFVSSASAQMMPPMPSTGDSVSVDTTNDATVTNSLTVVATTGDNDADGGDGEDGGDGGNATADRGLAIGGNGGVGGTGGVGGRIDTGNALAIGTLNNDINNNATEIVGCGCDDTATTAPTFFGWNTHRGDRTSVTNDSTASVSNDLHVIAETGDNEADGGDGDDGGVGGDAQTVHARTFWWFPVNTSSTAAGGNGGNGGQGATGGVITTGVSQSDGLVTNVVNRNITRILR